MLTTKDGFIPILKRDPFGRRVLTQQVLIPHEINISGCRIG